MPHDGPDQNVDVVGHDDIVAQHVTLPVEKLQRAFNNPAGLHLAQHTTAVAAIEFGFHLLAIELF